MVLPSSGQISFNDLRVELGVSSQAPFSITSASTGIYATINTISPSYPNSATPHQISEWYSYNHSATTTTTSTTTTTTTALVCTDFSCVDGVGCPSGCACPGGGTGTCQDA